VIFPTHYFLPIYIAQGLLAPLDHANLPHLQNVFAKFPRYPVRSGQHLHVPYGWGMTGLAHNATHTKDDPRLGSWALVFESGSAAL
jgi:spermidine/putrescine transport system substrate-binding protein